MKQKLFIFSTILLVLTAVSCNKKQQKEEIPTLTVGVMSSMDYLPLAVAQQQGYFKQKGIEVNLQKFFSANERDAAIQSNNLDGSILDYTGAAIQRAGGVDLHLIFQCEGTFELIARGSLDVQSDNDLRNKNYAVSRNTVIDFCTDMILESKGIGTNEVQKSEINKIPLRLEMLRNNKVDFSVLPDPFATMAKTSGNNSIISMEDLGYKVTGIVFTGKAIQEKKEAILAFIEAYNLAIKDLQEKPLGDFAELLVKEIGFPKEAVASVKLPNYSSANLPKASDLEAVSNWLKKQKIIATDFDINSLVYRDFLENK